MRRRLEWIGLGLALAATLASPSPRRLGRAEKVKKESVGFTRAYEILGELPMMHEGRIKPIDTVAREEIKSIYTRETIKLTSEDGKTVTSWSPVAAFFDWSVRPKFWDAQPIIAVEYLPLKRFILADEIKTTLESVAGKAATSEADRARLKALAAQAEIDGKSLRSAVREGKLAEDDALKLLDAGRQGRRGDQVALPRGPRRRRGDGRRQADAVRPVARRPDHAAASGPGA